MKYLANRDIVTKSPISLKLECREKLLITRAIIVKTEEWIGWGSGKPGSWCNGGAHDSYVPPRCQTLDVKPCVWPLRV